MVVACTTRRSCVVRSRARARSIRRSRLPRFRARTTRTRRCSRSTASSRPAWISSSFSEAMPATVHRRCSARGRLACRYVSQRLKGHGKVAIANGPATSGPLQLRVAGFKEELKAHPQIEIVEDQNTGMTQDGARAVMAGYLSRHADLDAVYGVNDPVAYYCELEALAHPDHQIFIVGMEGSPRSVSAMKDPQRLIEA